MTWLVADRARGDFVCYWYAGKGSDHLVEQARMASPALAVEWGRLRTPRVRIRLGDAHTYWAGTGTAPTDFARTWIDETAPEAAVDALAGLPSGGPAGGVTRSAA